MRSHYPLRFGKLLEFPLLIMFLTFINKTEVQSLNSKQPRFPLETERQVLNGECNCNKPRCSHSCSRLTLSHQILSLVAPRDVLGNSLFPLPLDTKFSNTLLGEAGKQTAASKPPPPFLRPWILHSPDVTQQRVVLYY